MTENSWNIEKQENREKKIAKVTRVVISTVLSVGGILLLASQIFPLAGSFLEAKIYEMKAATLAAPIPDSHKEYVSGQFAFYNPGESYFQNLTKTALEQGSLTNYTIDPVTREKKEIKVDSGYSKDMYLTISSAGINSIKISSNVESYEEEVYNLYLKSGLAHFKGTPIPGDGGNSFIYGHSAVPSFFRNNENLAETIFSKLNDVEIGDDVIVKRDGKDLKYIVRSKKIVEPNDFSILQSQQEKETVTMMTCWPLGVPSKRLIVVAQRYE